MSEPTAARAEPTEIANRYVVERKLGAGAFGTVYKARDKILGRMVAIKTIRLEGLAAGGTSLDELMTRFMREAQVSAQLKHPNIVTIYDIGEAAGLTYLAMEFIDGLGLEKVVRDSGPMPIERAATIAAQVADALDYAHRQNVVHRDIKPANIMLEAGDRVKVADFGIARVTNSADHLTATGSLLGTPSYMSPEQAKGSELDGRSDLFSVGCVLYEMIAGKRAFRGDSITGLIFKVITEEPPPLKELRSDTPDEMARVVGKAMAKAPQARYQTGREFVEALQPFLGAGVTPTIRQSETPTEALGEVPDLATAKLEPTLAQAPTRVGPVVPKAAPPPPAVKTAALPVQPAAPRHAPPAQAAAGARRQGSTGLFLALVAAGLVIGGGALAAAWFYLKPKVDAPASTAANIPATTPATLATNPTPGAQPSPVEAAAASTLAAEPARPEPPPTTLKLVAANSNPGPPATAAVAPPPVTIGTRPAATQPASGGDFSHLDDDRGAAEGGEGERRLPDQFRRGSSPYGAGTYRVRPKVPPGITPLERPAVATLLHLISAEESYNRKNSHYGSLQDLVHSRAAVLDVPVSQNGFQRRGYRFQVVVEDDGFKVTAVPTGSGLRAFAGDDTGFIKAGLQ